MAAREGSVSRDIKHRALIYPAQLLLGLEKLDLNNSCWFRPTLLEHHWGGTGPATPGIPPLGFKGSPTLLAKTRIKEMMRKKKRTLYPSSLPQRSLSIPPQPHQALIHHREALKAPIPPATLCPAPSKRGPQRPHQPPPHLTCGCSPSPPPHTARHRPTAIPEPPSSMARLTMAGDAGQQRVLAAVPGDCPHLAGASQLHSPPSSRRGLSG